MEVIYTSHFPQDPSGWTVTATYYHAPLSLLLCLVIAISLSILQNHIWKENPRKKPCSVLQQIQKNVSSFKSTKFLFI